MRKAIPEKMAMFYFVEYVAFPFHAIYMKGINRNGPKTGRLSAFIGIFPATQVEEVFPCFCRIYSIFRSLMLDSPEWTVKVG